MAKRSRASSKVASKHKRPSPYASQLVHMAADAQIFDSDGDLILLLPEHLEVSGEMKEDDGKLPDVAVAGDNPEMDESEQIERLRPLNVHMRVSSKHMILASKVFHAMLKRGVFKEGKELATSGTLELPLPDDDPAAFAILLNIIHGHTRKVPRIINLEMLTSISVLVDKYNLHEAVEVYSDMWITHLQESVDYTKQNFPRLSISWVFKKSDIFRDVTRQAQCSATDTFADNEAIGLPIPEAVIRTISPLPSVCTLLTTAQKGSKKIAPRFYKPRSRFWTPGLTVLCKRHHLFVQILFVMLHFWVLLSEVMTTS